MDLKKKLAALPLAVALAGVTAFPAAAQSPENQSGGAAGVVAAVVQVDRTLNDLVDVDLQDVNVEVVTVKNSFDNILRNARFLNDITILQDFLNESEFLQDFLNDNDVNVQDVVAIEVLSGGDIVVFQR